MRITQQKKKISTVKSNHTEFIQTRFNFTEVNLKNEVFLEQEEIVAQMCELIESAKEEVIFSTYVFKPSVSFDSIKQSIINLSQKAEKKIKIYIIFNQNPILAEKMISALRDRTLAGYSSSFDLNQEDLTDKVELNVIKYKSILCDSFHSKFMVIDRDYFLITGANISTTRTKHKCRVDLGIVGRSNDICNQFAEIFREYAKRNTSNPNKLPPLGLPPLHNNELEFDTVKANARVVHKMGTKFRYGNRTDDANQSLINLMDNAKNTITIRTPTLNEITHLDAIKRAASRGVKIRIILSFGFNQGTQRTIKRGSVSNDKIARQLLNWQDLNLKEKNIDLRWHADDFGNVSTNPHIYGYSGHAKYCCVDGEFVVLGSMNLDVLSSRGSAETNLQITGKEFADILEKDSFERYWSKCPPYADLKFTRQVSISN